MSPSSQAGPRIPLVILLCGVARKQAIYKVIKVAGCVNSVPPEEWAPGQADG